MWQVYLYLANEHQVRERGVRARERARRWSFGRRSQDRVARPDRADARSTTGPADRVH